MSGETDGERGAGDASADTAGNMVETESGVDARPVPSGDRVLSLERAGKAFDAFDYVADIRSRERVVAATALSAHPHHAGVEESGKVLAGCAGRYARDRRKVASRDPAVVPQRIKHAEASRVTDQRCRRRDPRNSDHVSVLSETRGVINAYIPRRCFGPTRKEKRMHFGDIDLELGGPIVARRPARSRHGIALERQMDEATMRRREVVAAVADARRSFVLSVLAGAWRAPVTMVGQRLGHRPGIVRNIAVTAANGHDAKGAAELLDRHPGRVWAGRHRSAIGPNDNGDTYDHGGSSPASGGAT